MAKRSYLDDIPESYLDCRAMTHNWRRTKLSKDTRAKLWVQTLTCQRCLTERVITLTLTGAIVSSHYAYSENYLLKSAPKGGLSQDDRATLRIRALTRATTDPSLKATKGRKVAAK